MQMNGWDLIVACSAESVNDQFSQNLDQMPASFAGEETTDNSTNQISGTFAAWSLVDGGSDGYLHFSAPITGGQLILAAGTDNAVKFDLTGLQPVFSLQLAFIDGPAGSSVKNLAFSTTVTGNGGNVDGSPVQLVTIDSGDVLAKVDPHKITAGILGRLLPRCLADNQDKMKFVFGQLNMIPADAQLVPQLYQYLYAQSGYLVVLVKTLTSNSQPTLDVDPALLAYDENFSKPDRIIGVHESAFTRLARVPLLNWPNVDGQSGLTIVSQTCNIVDDHLECTIHIKANWKDGAFSSADVDLTGTAQSSPMVNGTQVTSDQVMVNLTGSVDPDSYKGDFQAQFQSIQDDLTRQMRWSFDLTSLPWNEQINCVNAFLSGELLGITGSIAQLSDGGIQ